jgi:nucleoside phosphorylase
MNQSTTFNNANVGALTFGPNSPATGSVTLAPAPQPERAFGGAVPPRTLIIVAAAVERAAVRAEIYALNHTDPSPLVLDEETVLRLGEVAGTEVLLAQVGQGTVTPDSAGHAASSLIRDVRPTQVFLTGICYGLNDEGRQPQRLGDIVIAHQVKLIGHVRFGETERNRGGEVHPSPNLLSRLRVASDGWRGAPVHIGQVLSESVLLDNVERRAKLKSLYPEAIAGEMEAPGVYAAALRNKVDWALVKGISDWGHGKADDRQRRAAHNAAAFVARTLRIGGSSTRSHRPAG